MTNSDAQQPADARAEALTAAIRAACATIALHWDATLPAGVAPRTTATIHGTPDYHRMPIDGDVLKERQQAHHDLHFFARTILDERSEHYAMPGRIDNDVPALAAFVSLHAEWLAEHELGDAAADDLQQRARAIHGIANRHRAEQMEFVGVCYCGERVHARADADLITCETCGRPSLRTDLRAAARQRMRTTMPMRADELVTALALVGRQATKSTIRSWHDRGKVEPVACDPKDKAHRYWYAEVEPLARKVDALSA